jgi:hypothetical protein
MDVLATVDTTQRQLIAVIAEKLQRLRDATTEQTRAFNQQCSASTGDSRALLEQVQLSMAITSRLVEIELLEQQLAAAQQLLQQMTTAYESRVIQSTVTHTVELVRSNNAQQININSIIVLVLLLTSISCLMTVDPYPHRLSNINAVSNNSLSGDYHFPASGYNSNTITAISKETYRGAVQYSKERDNSAAITHAVTFPSLYNHVIAGVLIYDPGGS